MKKAIFLTLLIIFTLAICIVGLKTEFRDELSPQISQSSDYNGVLV